MLKDISIKVKLGLSFFVVLLLTALGSLLAIGKLANVNDKSTEISTNWMPSIALISELNTQTSDFRIRQLEHVVSQSNTQMVEIEAASEKILESIETDAARYETLISSAEEKALYSRFSEAWQKYLTMHEEQVLVLSRGNHTEQVMALLSGEAKNMFDLFSSDLALMVAMNREGGDDASLEGDLIYAEARTMIFGVLIITLIVSGLLSVVLTRAIWTPLGAEPTHLLEIIDGVSAGRLDQELNPEDQAQSGVMAGLVAMQKQLREVRDERDRVATERAQQEEDKRLAAESQVVEQQKRQSEQEEAARQVQTLVDAASRGELDSRIDIANMSGNYAQLGKSMNQLLESVQSVIDDVCCSLDALADGDLTRKINKDYQGSFRNLKDGLNATTERLAAVLGQLGQSVTTLNGSSAQLSTVNERMRSSANDTADQTNVASSAAEEISTNVTTVASAVEEMSASIREIARNSGEAKSVANQAVELAGNTDTMVRQLSDSSEDIGAVIKSINSIAEQTNLLALNATIEAARAGEAGKGFAVVANEVKELAKATSFATDEIGQKIATIQLDSRNTVKAIGDISQIIDRINDIQSTIAAAVEEQSATTVDISRSVTETSEGSSEIARNVSQVAQVASQNLELVDSAQSTVGDLTEMAEKLDEVIKQFTLDRAA